jgi:hypothetical protein
MDSCVIKPAGRGDINVAMQLFVIGKTRQAYEQRNYILTPDEYIAMGKVIEDGFIVFGITDIRFFDMNENIDGTYTIKAVYDYYYPAGAEEKDEDSAPGAAALPTQISRTDIITLVYQKDMWKIQEIVREEY